MEKKLVVVAWVPVALPKIKLVRFARVPKIDDEKKFVVVACEEVELTAVKFCKVLEPVTWRLDSQVRPPVAVTVPVKFAALEIV